MQVFLRLPAAFALAAAAVYAGAQTPADSNSPTPPVQTSPAPPAGKAPAAAQKHGKVLFQSHGDPPQASDPNGEDGTPVAGASQAPTGREVELPAGKDADLTDAQRSAVTITAYDLDARMTPVRNALSMRALLTVRNSGATPLDRVALQISSTLKWESAELVPEHVAALKLPLAQHLLDTDTDHTGRANELVVLLPTQLAPGASVRLDLFYSGTIAQNGARLARLGADVQQAADADWDEIAPNDVSLRGYGNVLWYPVASPQYFLGQGNDLFEAIGRMRLREAAAKVRLRLALEFQGEPPASAFFCGRWQPLRAISDNADAPVATNAGVATVEFANEPLGYRAMSLFIAADKPEAQAQLGGAFTDAASGPIAAEPTFSSSNAEKPAAAVRSAPVAVAGSGAQPTLLQTVGVSPAQAASLASQTEIIAPVLAVWFGDHPWSPLTIVDRPGQAFEEGPLLVAPASALASPDDSSSLAYSLAHDWAQTGQPWMDEGLSGFATLLVAESQHGRDAAIAALNDLLQPVQIAEPEFDSAAALVAPDAPQGQPLIAATNEVFYRRKAAAVFWMLRSVVGDTALEQALHTLLLEKHSNAPQEQQALAFETLLEKASGQDLSWLFQDWVLHDRGLPDLSFVDVTPRALPAGKGHDAGWLVSVTVKNDGAATADVPVVIRSGAFTAARRMRIGPFAQAVDRIVVEAEPDQVIVNDGSVPEIRTSEHIRNLTKKP